MEPPESLPEPKGPPSTRSLDARSTAIDAKQTHQLSNSTFDSSEDVRRDDPPANRLGRFVVLDTLGTGGMGVVLEAYDHVLDRTVALKLLHRTSDDRHRERLVREAKALARLSHPNVVQVYDIGEVDDTLYIAMELVHGQTLRKWESKDLDWKEVVRVYMQAGEGLAAAHEHGLIHRDFKPENCIIADNGRVRVLDFGLAREVTPRDTPPQATPVPGTDRTSQRLTKAGSVVGTVAFMSREQLVGLPATELSDQYSFCASLFEALYGTLPYQGNTALELLEAIEDGKLTDTPPRMHVPRRLKAVLRRGLHRDPEGRWPSMRDLLDRLRALIRPRRWWRIHASAALGMTLGAGSWAAMADQPRPCQDTAAALEGVWDETTSAALQQTLERRLGADDPLGARVLTQLGRYAGDWLEMAEASCRATFVTQLQSTPTFDRRMRCLERGRNRLESTVSALLDAEDRADLITRSQLSFKLPGLEPCADLEQLAAVADGPRDPAVRQQAQRLRRRIDRAHTLREAGAVTEGLELASKVRDEAMELGDPLVQAEALECLGRLQTESSKHQEATQSLSEAVVLASEVRDDRLAARAWLSLLYAMSMQSGDLAGAEARVLAAQAAVERTDDDALRAWWLNNRGIIEAKRDHPKDAQATLERALELKMRTLGEAHFDVGIAWFNLATLRGQEQEYDAALIAYERAQSVLETTVGDEHPLAIYVVAGKCDAAVGMAAMGMEDDQVAIDRCFDALEQVQRSQHPSESYLRSKTATALWQAGYHDSARAMVESMLHRPNSESLEEWAAAYDQGSTFESPVGSSAQL